LTETGKYAVYAEGIDESGEGTLTALSLTPRVFSPRGSFANSEAAVSFVLGRSGPVTVKVYNRAGRVVREVVSGEYLGAGANLVRWDGRDGNGDIVGEGLYLVSVEALGQKQVKTVSVVK
jgi:flagellar hook assembly protein FlgD